MKDPGFQTHTLPPLFVPEIQAKSITLPNYRTINNLPENHRVKRDCWWHSYPCHDNPYTTYTHLYCYRLSVLFFLRRVDDSSSWFPDLWFQCVLLSMTLGLSLRICDPVCSRHPALTMADLDWEIFISWLSNHCGPGEKCGHSVTLCFFI